MAVEIVDTIPKGRDSITFNVVLEFLRSLCEKYGGPSGIRTPDQRIMSPLL